MDKQTIRIPMAVYSRNKIDKMHWSEKRRLRQNYQLFVRQQMSHFRYKKADPKEMFAIEIAACRMRPIRDHDNLVGGCKQLIDALSQEQFIWDDSSEFIGIPAIKQHKLTGKDTEDGDFTLVSRTTLGLPSYPTLEEVLKKQGRKKSWLAEELACENSTVTRWIQTNEIPKIKRKKIEKVLGVRLGD